MEGKQERSTICCQHVTDAVASDLVHIDKIGLCPHCSQVNTLRLDSILVLLDGEINNRDMGFF